jgi:dTDP-4-dehydrorhamnose reductase
MIILLTGRDGQVGWELQRTLAPLGQVVAPEREELDLTALRRVRDTVRRTHPDVIVNAAAYTAVDRAEDEAELASVINAEAPEALAEEAERCGALLLHYSTDYVFSGVARRPYREDDPTGPLSAYGRSKLQGETAIRQSGARAIILRTGWVYATRGRNFLLTIQKLARERAELGVVDDQRGAPTWARLIAEATAAMLAMLRAPERRDAVFGEQRCRIYHATCAGETTWHGFASEIVARMRAGEGDARVATVRPIATSDYPTKAVRPPYSVLANDALQRDFGIALPHWQQGLALCLES